MSFQVDIAQYYGPLDLLLHIVRREELDVCQLPLANIVQQYLEFLDVLVELNIDDVGDFLEVASLLIELKSKQALPSQQESSTEDASCSADELADDLVQRLVDYKRIRDASSILEEQSHRWQLRYTRLANDLPSRRVGTDQQPIQPIEIWDLVSAFGRILRERQLPPTAETIYDDTPIQSYMTAIHQRIREQGQVELTSLFTAGMHKSTLVAMFLAMLELARHYGVTTLQREPLQPLYLVPGKDFSDRLDLDRTGSGKQAG